MEEYLNVKKEIKTGKVSGPDGIPSEVLKFCDLDDTVLFFANEIMTKQQKPDQWCYNHFIPIPRSLQ